MNQYLSRSKVRIFESVLEKLARILAEKYGIKVIFRHDTCMTDGKTIYLPIIPDNASDEFLAAIQGFLDHEVGHLIFSDFKAIRTLEHKNRKQWSIFQTLEDGRIESEMRKLWRGSGVNLSRCNDWALRQLQQRWDELTDFGKFCQGVAILGCDGEQHWFVQDVLKKDQALWDRLEKVKDLIEEAKSLPDSKETIKQAEKLMVKLGEVEDPEPEEEQGQEPQKEQRKGEAGEEDEEGDEEEGVGGEGEDEDEEGETGSGTSGDGDEEGEEGEREEGEPKRTSKRPTNADFENVSEESMKKDEQISSRHNMIRTAARAEFSSEDRYLIYTTEGDMIERITSGDKFAALQFLRESRAMVNVLQKKMRLNLLSIAQAKWEPDKRRGKLNPKAIFRVPLGTSKRVFRQRVEAPGFDTRCSLWVDHSGSMAGYKIDLAAKAAMLFGEVLNELGIPFEICGYSTRDYRTGQTRYEKATSEDQKIYSRWGDLWVGIYKAFDEDWRLVRHRCHQMSRNQRANTYDGESIRLAAARLNQYEERRRILFVFNDGCPCPNVGCKIEEHTRYCKEMAKEVEKIVELFAVGICSPQVKDFYSNNVNINAVEDLPKVMLTQLDAMLRGGKNLIQGKKKAS